MINNLSLSCKREEPGQLVRPRRTTTHSLLFVLSLSLSHFLLPLFHVRILPPAIKITVATFLLTAKYSFRFDCMSTDMNGRSKKRPTKRSTAIEGFCVLLKLRRFSPPTCDGCLFRFYSLNSFLARFAKYDQSDFMWLIFTRCHSHYCAKHRLFARLSGKWTKLKGYLPSFSLEKESSIPM